MPASDHLALLITASAAGEDLRRTLLLNGIELAGTTGSLGRLRRELVCGGFPSTVVLCITLDEPTLRRHGTAIKGLLDDRRTFATSLHAIGILDDQHSDPQWPSLGCDAHVQNASELSEVLDKYVTALRAGSVVADRTARLDVPNSSARKRALEI